MVFWGGANLRATARLHRRFQIESPYNRLLLARVAQRLAALRRKSTGGPLRLAETLIDAVDPARQTSQWPFRKQARIGLGPV
jgi:hypothetical protein